MIFKEGDIIEMKKSHPCGSKQWQVLKTGLECTVKCLGCGHVILIKRSDLEKNIKKVAESK